MIWENELLAQSTWGGILTFAAVALYAALHSLLASQTVKSWSHRTFGELSERGYRLAFNLIGALTFLPVLAVPLLLPGQLLYTLRPPWLWLSGALQLGSIGLLIVGLRQTGAAEFLGLAQLLGSDQRPSELVTAGLYRWVRHPLYTAGLVFIWLLPVMTTSLVALNLGLTLYLYVGSVFEERKLVTELGPAYERYQRQVPRLIPLPWKRYEQPGDRGEV